MGPKYPGVELSGTNCYLHLRDFRQFRRYLTHDASVLVANALVNALLMVPLCGMLFL